ncbi:MAG: YHS domain-containing protein [Candidatus Zixiibacteriota bacterium]
MKRLSLLLIIVIGVTFLYLSFANLSAYSGEEKPKATEHKIAKEEIGKKFTCAMCKMKMKVAKNTPAVDYAGETYYFCSSGEKKLFSKDPEMYLATEKSAKEELTYTEHKITEEEIGKQTVCPVMKRSFTVSKDTPAIEFQGTTYYFCCPGCIGKFMASHTESDSLKVKSDSLKAEPDSLHHNKSTGGAHKHKGCC